MMAQGLASAKRDREMPERQQFAALPYIVIQRRILVCLVTSRETHRWIIPKGWPKKKLAPHVLAAREALEEAGLTGVVSPAPVGSYTYQKRMRSGPPVPCRVTVYPMLVTGQALDWPERKERDLVWLPSREAARRVDEPELAALLEQIESMQLRQF